MPDIAWTVLAWAIGLAGLGCIVWGRVRVVRARRPGGPRRCPRCWHDLSATDGLRCIECGRVARRERQLRRPRRRRLPAVAGLALLAIAPVVARVPAARTRGWPAIVPTPVLLAVFPVADAYGPRLIRNMPGTSIPATTERVLTGLGDEMLRRAAARRGAELHAVYWRLAVELAILSMEARGDAPSAIDPTRANHLLVMAYEQGRLTSGARARADRLARLVLDVPTALPADVAVTATMRVAHWRNATVAYRIRDRRTGTIVHMGITQRRRLMMISGRYHPWTDDRTPIGRTAGSDTTLALAIELDEFGESQGVGGSVEPTRRLRTYDVDIPIAVTGSVAEAFERRADEAVGTGLLAGVGRPFDRSWRGGFIAVRMDEAAARTAARDAGIDTIAVRFELRDGDTVLARTATWWDVPSPAKEPGDLTYFVGESRGDAIVLRWVGSSEAPSDGLGSGDLRLYVVGDPLVASRRKAASVIWDGEASMPWPPPVADRP